MEQGWFQIMIFFCRVWSAYSRDFKLNIMKSDQSSQNILKNSVRSLGVRKIIESCNFRNCTLNKIGGSVWNHRQFKQCGTHITIKCGMQLCIYKIIKEDHKAKHCTSCML